MPRCPWGARCALPPPRRRARIDGLTGEQVRGALAALVTCGKVGYDWSEAGWFHRELPYRTDLLTAPQPRYVAARALIAAGACSSGTPTARTGTTGGLSTPRRQPSIWR
ncbi:hypothetical protein AB0368_26555 [Actinoplanes sp. NPDC051475]|uniref:hypothetical protein n=1 Tax=Actinoplanes sp. NPDC051475 TaxID=3157225 RepID=UPI00344B0581